MILLDSHNGSTHPVTQFYTISSLTVTMRFWTTIRVLSYLFDPSYATNTKVNLIGLREEVPRQPLDHQLSVGGAIMDVLAIRHRSWK